MTHKEYAHLKELDGFLNELRILLYDKFYRAEIDNLHNQPNKGKLNDRIESIFSRPMFELDISQEDKSFNQDYRLRDSIGNKLSLNLKQYESATLKLLAMLNDYEKENKIER